MPFVGNILRDKIQNLKTLKFAHGALPFIFFYLCIYLTVLGLSWGMWDLVPQ